MSAKNLEDMEYVVDLLFEDDEEGALEYLLLENEEEQIVRSLDGEITLMNYLINFEEYLDDHDIYLFDGWDKAEVLKPVKVDKFWCTFFLHVGPETDLRGALRVTNDKEGQNQIKAKKLDNGGYVLKFKILKRYLDQIAQDNKERSDALSDEEMEKS